MLTTVNYKNNIVEETTCFIINEPGTSVFNKLQPARYAVSTWIRKIILNIPTPPCFYFLLTPSTAPVDTTSIVPFLQYPSAQLRIILKHQVNYPDHCNSCLEGYNGMVYSKRLVSSIITAASKTEHI